jgi:hypothetical protein
MNAGPFDRFKKAKLAFGILTVTLIVCALLGVMLFFMGRQHPRF